MIYLDHNATTPIDSRVLESMGPYLKSFYGNPSSAHRLGRASRTAIETAREQIAKLVSAEPAQVIFTAGGTEANNLAILGSVVESKNHILYGATEHPSVANPISGLALADYDVETIPVNETGVVSLEQLNSQIKNTTGLISIMHANNETGVIQDIQGLSKCLIANKSILHVDAIQSVGKINIDFSQIGAKLMSISSHKMYGPKGVGALIRDTATDIEPVIRGGGQENSIRPGTENVAAIVGFGKAADLALIELEQRTVKLQRLQKTLEKLLNEVAGLQIVSENENRLPNTTQAIIDGMDGEMILMLLDKSGICISGGSACSSRVHSPSPVLMAMGYTRTQSLSAIRISLGIHNTLDEVNTFVETLKIIIKSQHS